MTDEWTMQPQKLGEIREPSDNVTDKPTSLVSVIIPTYNCGQYIQEAIESVLDQNYSSYEVIVVDDGSTDNTRRILEPYAGRVHYAYQENAGQAAARNLGLKMASGEFVNFLDADDYFLQQKLKNQVALFESDPSIGAVHSGWKLVDQSGETIQVREPWKEIPCLDLKSWLLWMPVLPGAMMFRKDWLDRVEGFNPNLRWIEDLDIILRLALAGCQD